MIIRFRRRIRQRPLQDVTLVDRHVAVAPINYEVLLILSVRRSRDMVISSARTTARE
jgi:hypothetical protein